MRQPRAVQNQVSCLKEEKGYGPGQQDGENDTFHPEYQDLSDGDRNFCGENAGNHCGEEEQL